VRTDDDIHTTPKFKCAFEEMSVDEQAEERSRRDFLRDEYPHLSPI
jgi:hypothetical protein